MWSRGIFSTSPQPLGHLEGGLALLYPVQSFPQVQCSTEAWPRLFLALPYRRKLNRRVGVSGPGYLLRCRRKRLHGAAGPKAAGLAQGLLQGAVLPVER